MSRKRPNGSLYLDQPLKDMGYLAFKNTNPIKIYNPDRVKYIELWQNYDYNQCVARYYYKGLPNGLTSWMIERMLYYNHSVAGFRFGGQIYVLPYVIEGNINPYGIPTKIRPITYNGQAVGGRNSFFAEDFTLPIDIEGNENEDYSAVLLYDSVPIASTTLAPPRYCLNRIIIKEMADVFARVNINVVVSNKKILLQIRDPKQRDIVVQELQSIFSSDCPFGVITSPLEAGSVQSTSDFNADELFNVIKNYDGIRCFMSGISSKGFGVDKKERLISGELNGINEEKDLILDMGYELRKEWCDLMNKKFGLNISVHKRCEDFDNQTAQDVDDVIKEGEYEL